MDRYKALYWAFLFIGLCFVLVSLYEYLIPIPQIDPQAARFQVANTLQTLLPAGLFLMVASAVVLLKK
ncbi:hypothetical protein B9Q11_00355 [Candidatus Marsarchaeota G2 archaeon ECH_B_SAG-F08]|uniref:Uncharacterized protein n=7 Tax=Candidatus Marsarchaeota TaxID=1978152 RepID=A0A2R6AAZ1_9ARCH|nr:MAG: hypothetical protein B9Q02_10475 [Candidatus Marsarchaeota G1 archaeon BE_D]PSN83894.1 MAG: hypothetical protein B9Q01_02985 [Candidatus Marsarchaeota G1 archaeon OSP_D]PSN88638.1 MAG: hypothetical protein B9Q00_04625 [Candidatus Marsarchaeota G1 archaeon OSP_C]PSN95455.1 MAG: hypothetical protein B9P99_01045 [Candidatus Marsarchaeota G1 archaeon OSP_B]PSO00024.1 MAG: hypothetical protein B9Q11_00355 [Candidatus Marsarchaeota G2 archaeon ECH_B_SAG-F08]PSO01922.1 MAG: hypothetical prote